jgi:hypothetical protein
MRNTRKETRWDGARLTDWLGAYLFFFRVVRACPKTICSAHFVASLCRTLCRTVRFLAIFDKVGRQSARQRSRMPFVGQVLYSPAGINRAPRRGHPRCAVPWFLSPHPSPLPWGEGEPFSPRRTIQTRRLSTARCALFPLPEGEGQGEGKRRELPSRVSDHSRNCRTGRGLQQSRRFPQMTKKWNRGPCHEL